jgi:hypothetical protein
MQSSTARAIALIDKEFFFARRFGSVLACKTNVLDAKSLPGATT